MKLGVGVISNRDWEPEFGVSAVQLFSYLGQQGVAGRQLEALGFFPKLHCSDICKARYSVLKKAIEQKFTHLLFVDDDMEFPPDICDALASHGEHDVIGCNYRNKTLDRPTCVDMSGKYCFSKDKTDVEEVISIGFGCVLIDLKVPQKIEMPWFAHAWLDHLQDTTTDDVYFCLKAREQAGARIYVDHAASHRVKHLGKDKRTTI